MRSVNAPRVAHDATVEIGAGGRARAVNLSTGGIFIAADEPLDPGEQVHLKVNLKDGATPIDVDAEVVWKADGGMALRFRELDDVAKKRITRIVQKREPTIFGKRDVRIHLPSLPAPLRASARDLTERGVMIEAELPWLRLGSSVTTELSPERACDGRVQWIGLDVTRSGSARLRIFVDLAEEGAPGSPPPSVFSPAEDAMPTADAMTNAPSRGGEGNFRWVWPAIAMVCMLACGGLATALFRQPPVPTLLPTAPPERDAPVARMPKSLAVPVEKQAEAATPANAAPANATTAKAAAAPTSAVATPTPSEAPPAPAPAKKKLHGKKKPVTRRAG